MLETLLVDIWNDGILKDYANLDEFKLAVASSLYKKENPLLAKNYRTVSILPTVTQIFERFKYLKN